MAHSVILAAAPDFNNQGWCEKTGHTNHTMLMAWVATLDYAALDYTKKDAIAAASAMPDGHKAGHYIDTAHYCGMELTKRNGATQ